ncbi:hypothetical protein [Nocardia sp. NPDC019395]|uniref:hypothetical protein n=1 Tax=Nocardia sp. NPDC019395 TaxID=3154686 RepID=UPI0033FF54D8
MTASGPYGDVHTDAFGRLEGSVPALRNTGERPTDGVVPLNGIWGVLTGIAAVVTLAGVQLYRRTGIGLSLVFGGSTANTVFVSVTLLYLNGKAPELRDMTDDRDELKEMLSSFVSSVFGDGAESGAGEAQRAATAALTNQALISGFVAVAAAVIALGIRNRVASVTGEAGEVSATYVAGEVLNRDPATEVGDVHGRKLDRDVRRERRRPGRKADQPNQAGRPGRERPPARRRRSRPADRVAAVTHQ